VAADSLAGAVVDGADSTIATYDVGSSPTMDGKTRPARTAATATPINNWLGPFPHALPRVGWRDCLWTDCGTNCYKVATEHCIVATIRQGPMGRARERNNGAADAGSLAAAVLHEAMRVVHCVLFSRLEEGCKQH
jgi:hypothetical protein